LKSPSAPPHGFKPGFAGPLYASYVGESRELSRGVRLSLIAHGAIAALILIKSLVFPSKTIPFIPTLRVDIVGLPDVLKKDKFNQPIPAALPTPAKPAEKPREKSKAEPALPNEMVLKPKAKAEEAAREKKIKGALDRIKALQKINDDSEKAPAVVKGNKISKGSSLSDDARESDQASYYDQIRDKLQQNWELPVWLSRQDLSARVQLMIDSRGILRGFRFIKASGNAQFDEAVKKTIKDSQPFPIPPTDIAGSLASNGILVGFPL